MIKIIPYETLGHADHEWLKARYHFSFARYVDRARMGLGALRVINDDQIAAGKGFGAHPHDNMEIITYVRTGAITHKDSLGNEGRISAGDVQVMSAGSGVLHAEMNLESVDTTLYQIWIVPGERDVAPRWQASIFPKENIKERLHILVSGRAEDKDEGALFIHQDAAIYGGNIGAGKTVSQLIKHQAYILASKGRFSINGQIMKQGDGAEVRDEKEIEISALSDTEILVIDIPAL